MCFLRFFLNDVIVLLCHFFNGKEFQISVVEYLRKHLPVLVCVTGFCKSDCDDSLSIPVVL